MVKKPTVYYKLKKTQCADEYSVHKMTAGSHLICELHVTVKLYRATCSLSDADSHFFQIRRISVRTLCL